jgi:hypothetical protein
LRNAKSRPSLGRHARGLAQPPHGVLHPGQLALSAGFAVHWPYTAIPRHARSPVNPVPQRLPGRWLSGAIPLLWLGGMTGWVWIRWAYLPPMMPVHWGLNGFPDLWVRRTPSAVAMRIGIMGALCLAFIALAALLLHQPPQARSPEATAAERVFRRRTALLIVACAWFIAFQPAFSLLPLPYGSFRIWMLLFAATLLTGVGMLVRSGLRLRSARLR